MALVVSIANYKGGVGKSTIAINLAGVLSDKFKSVLLVDADPQGTTSDWNQRRQTLKDTKHPNLNITSSPWTENLINLIPENSKKFPLIIIDCGPAHDKITKTAIALSHITLIPITPSPYDIISAKKTISSIEQGKNSSIIDVQPYLVISRKISGTNLGKDVKSALKVFKMPIFKTEICQRIALCEAGIDGKTIDEYAPDSKATEEFIKLGKEILKCQNKNFRN